MGRVVRTYYRLLIPFLSGPISGRRPISSTIHDRPDGMVCCSKGISKIHEGLLKWTDSFHDAFFNRHDATGTQPYSGKVGECDVENFDMANRVVADRLTLSFAIAGGSCPGNEGREYFLRRILLRAVCYWTKIKIFSGLVNIVVKVMGDVFPELRQHELHTRDTIEDKEASFGKIFLYECASHNAYTQEQALEFLKKKECASHNVYTQEQALEFLEKKNKIPGLEVLLKSRYKKRKSENWTIMQSRRYLHIPAQSAVIMHSYSQDVPDCFFREAHNVWLAEIGKFVGDLMNHDNARELLTGFVTYLSHLDFVRWYRTANPWSREEIYEHVCGKPIFVVENALESMLEHPVLPLTWESPPPGSLKLNFDASYYESGRGGWAGVLRDEKGDIVDIFYGYLDHVDSPYEAEMLALYHSLVKALECGYQDKKLIVEGDCKNLIDAVNGELNCDDDPYVQFYCEINRFKTKFKECQIEFNYREVNSLADFVAGLAAMDIMGDFNQYEIDKICSIAIDDMRVTRYRFHQAENALRDLWDSLDKAWQEREYEREYEEQMKEDNFFIWQEQMKEDNLKWLQE